MTLGIDCSTNVCGWAFSETGSVIDAGYIDLTKLITNKEKCFYIINNLRTHDCFKKINHVNLEAALSGFMGGGTTQQTIIKLVRFNAIFEYILMDELKLPVNLCNVSTMRKKVFGKARIKGMTGKEYVKSRLPYIVSNIERFHVLNKRGRVDKKVEDIYDAIVASLF